MKLCYLLPSGDMFYSMVKSEAENVMEAEIGGLVMVIRAYNIEQLDWSFGIRSSGM